MKICKLISAPAFVLSALLALLVTGCSSSKSPAVTPLTVTAISPASLPIGATSTTLTITGTGFLNSSVVQIAGVNQPTTFVSATQLTTSIPSSLLSSAGNLPVVVMNGSTSSATGTPVTVEIDNPAPAITSFSPTYLVAGTAPAVTITGTGFVSTSTVQVGATSRPTAYISSTQVGVIITPADIPAYGTTTLKVLNPGPGGGTSNAASVTILAPPVPTLSALVPSDGPIGSDATIHLAGGNFTPSTIAYVNSTAVPTTYNSYNDLTVTIPASLLSRPGNLNVLVSNPGGGGPGGGTTLPKPFTAYVGIRNNSMVYNPASGLLYISVPSSAGAPYGNSVVSIDPATGSLGTPIPVGSEPNNLSLSSDGKFLWVSLDGTASVRKVDLSAGTAGLQFSTTSLPPPSTPASLAALPGSPDSVVVSGGSGGVGIYDNGVLRGSVAKSNTFSGVLQVDAAKQEIYLASGVGYQIFTYDSSGLTLKTSFSVANTLGRLQTTGGISYASNGNAYNTESGSIVGTFLPTGSTTPAKGWFVVDPTLSRSFILNYIFYPNRVLPYLFDNIQAFNTSDYTPASTEVIPVNSDAYSNETPLQMVRWGVDGIAINAIDPTHVKDRVYSIRSSVVRALSTANADLSVSIAANGSNTVGSNTTYTATIKNAGPADATNVGFTGIVPASGIVQSISSSQGTCSLLNTVACNLGGIANGASVTVTTVITQAQPGSSTFTGQVIASQTDSNQSDNQSSSTVLIN